MERTARAHFHLTDDVRSDLTMKKLEHKKLSPDTQIVHVLSQQQLERVAGAGDSFHPSECLFGACARSQRCGSQSEMCTTNITCFCVSM